MNEKVPYTPLSTHLSGSARETEFRLRNIFSGPKKRPPTLFLALVFAVCIFCGNLVSCQNAEAEPSGAIAGMTANIEGIADELAPTYTLGGARTVLVEGLDDHIVWSRGTDGGGLDFSGVGFCCSRLANEKVGGGAYWLDGEKSILYVYLNVNDSCSQDGNAGGIGFSFTADMNSDTVTQREFTSEIGDRVIELTDQELMDAAYTLAKLLTESWEFYQSHVDWLTPHPVSELPTALAEVLQGESKIVLSKMDPPVFLNEVPAIIDPSDPYMGLERYAVVDLLGSGTPEVLVCICGVSGEPAGYLLLTDWGNEPVHGYLLDRNNRYGDWRVRWLTTLKTDGTFECADEFGGEQWRSISYLRLTAASGWALCGQAVCWSPDAPSNEIPPESFMSMECFMLMDQELTEEEFEQALEVQRAKPDVTWYEFPL